MTRKVACLCLDSESLTVLHDLVGQPWGCVTGNLAPEAPGFTLVSWAEVSAEIGGRAWTISSEMTGSDFEGFDEFYPNLHVSPHSTGMKNAKIEGRVFYQHRGETVERIFIVRETISRQVGGEVQWQLSTDIAVVFVLSGGAACVAKGGYHDEALFVSFADKVESLHIPDRSIEWSWDDQLGESYDVERVWLAKDELPK